MLTTNRLGADTGQPLIIAHGLFGSARNWGVLARRLSDARPVITVDMRNHGTSPWFDTNSYGDMAGDLAEIVRAQGGRADILGHSMGGKAAMVLALQQPELVHRLIVADIAPVAYGHSQTHLIDAMEAVDLQMVRSRRDVDAQLAAAVPEDGVRAFLLQSLDLKGDAARWVLNLPSLRRAMADIIGFPDIEGQFDGASLFLSGGASDYVKPSDHGAIRALFSTAEFEVIDGAGHWLHAEKPREFEAALRRFLPG